MKNKPVLKLGLIVGIAVLLCGLFSALKLGREPEETGTKAAGKTRTEAAKGDEKDPARSGEESGTGTGTDGASKDPSESGSTSESTESTSSGIPKETEKKDFPIPGRLFEEAGLVTDSDAFCVIDQNGNIVIAKNEAAAYAPASITKVLTALVVLEHASLEDKVTVREEDILSVDIMSSGVYPSLKTGEVLTVEDLLYALILPSTNAAGAVLASFVLSLRERPRAGRGGAGRLRLRYVRGPEGRVREPRA